MCGGGDDAMCGRVPDDDGARGDSGGCCLSAATGVALAPTTTSSGGTGRSSDAAVVPVMPRLAESSVGSDMADAPGDGREAVVCSNLTCDTLASMSMTASSAVPARQRSRVC